ncbi:MAG: class I SAM-dependent methyltransferase [Cyanobacteria bacterium]|nr:class I SAM-dependent methyltransferase [Cyanobacteriota bacterium]
MKAEDVLRFHQQLGAEYLAYAYPESSAVYPTGQRRTTCAAAAIHAELGRAPQSAVDLGSGAGDLCFLLASSGATVVGVDFADTMIAAAEKRLQALPAEIRARVTFSRADIFQNSIPSGSVDAVSALGVIETEPEDGRLFAEAKRMLKPGGVFAVSCRNRLFNVMSVNRHTRRELQGGGLDDLLAEAERLMARSDARKTEAALAELVRALAASSATNAAAPPVPAPAPISIGETRQHTPESLAKSAGANGFTGGTFIGVHPHPFPPALEALAPELYNRVAAAAEGFEREPLGLLWSSAFVAAFTKA